MCGRAKLPIDYSEIKIKLRFDDRWPAECEAVVERGPYRSDADGRAGQGERDTPARSDAVGTDPLVVQRAEDEVRHLQREGRDSGERRIVQGCMALARVRKMPICFRSS